MSQVVLQVALAAALVGISCLAARRSGYRVAGIAGALPAIAGPFLLLVADERGDRAAATAANGTLAGLLMLSGFAVGYTQTARRHGWLASLAVGWAAAAVLAMLVDLSAPGAPLGALLAVGSLMLAWRWMPTRGVTQVAPPRTGGFAQALSSMAAAALLVFLLADAVAVLGEQVGGALAGLPVITTVLAVTVHRRFGTPASTMLIRGTLEGMAGFVVFCEVVAALAVRGGTTATFVSAACAALAVQAAVVHVRRPPLAVSTE